jgi:hypothetical protein
VADQERSRLDSWLTLREAALFDGMAVADQRHGLDVVADLRRHGVDDLRRHGVDDHDLLLAGLLHDCGKSRRIRLVHRVAWSLGVRYGGWILASASLLPTFRAGLAALRDHAERSAVLMAAAGCSARAVELVRNQEAPTDEAGRLLLAADEAN